MIKGLTQVNIDIFTNRSINKILKLKMLEMFNLNIGE